MEAHELMDILKEEYGVTNEQELDKAIENLGGLDITVFQCNLDKERDGGDGRKSKDHRNTGRSRS